MVLKIINWLILPSPIVMIFIDEILNRDFFHRNIHWIMIGWFLFIIAKIVYFARK